jgi:hypothetical protein
MENKKDLDLASRDEHLQNIQKQIIAKRQLLLDKQKMLKDTSKQNHFLKEVYDDYGKYYIFIMKQKEQQISAMNTIKEYLNDIIVSGKLTNKDILLAKKEQKKILAEINNVKSSLNEIVNETNDVDKKNI